MDPLSKDRNQTGVDWCIVCEMSIPFFIPEKMRRPHRGSIMWCTRLTSQQNAVSVGNYSGTGMFKHVYEWKNKMKQ